MEENAAPSKYLPGTKIQYAWDATSLSALKTCPRLYQYTIIEGWKTPDESVHLRFGIEYHQALQEYDIVLTSGLSPAEALFDTIRSLAIRTADWRPDHKYKNRNNLFRTVIWYLDNFRNDPAQTYIDSNGKPLVEASFRFSLDFGPSLHEDWDDPDLKTGPGQPYLLCGHLDRIVTYAGDLYVMDRKTTTMSLGSYYFNQFSPNNQMSLYSLAAKLILNSPVRGVIIDAAEIKIDFSRFGRHGPIHHTPDQLTEWLDDTKIWLSLAEQYAIAGHWPMNDTACDKFGGCRFREICSKSPGVREKFLESNFVKGEIWNPLIPR